MALPHWAWANKRNYISFALKDHYKFFAQWLKKTPENKQKNKKHKPNKTVQISSLSAKRHAFLITCATLKNKNHDLQRKAHNFYVLYCYRVIRFFFKEKPSETCLFQESQCFTFQLTAVKAVMLIKSCNGSQIWRALCLQHSLVCFSCSHSSCRDRKRKI